MKSIDQNNYPETFLELAEKHSHSDDVDINESLVRALEASNDFDRKFAVKALIALDDLFCR